jgi:hypothetical protein
MIKIAPTLATKNTFINVSFKENVSSKVSSFNMIKRRLLNRFSLSLRLLWLLLDISFDYRTNITIIVHACIAYFGFDYSLKTYFNEF